MTIHKRTRLTPSQRKEIASLHTDGTRVCDLIRQYSVSPSTIYKILHRARDKDYTIHKSTNKRYRCLEYGLKRLSKIEKELEEKLKKEAKRYNKRYPGEMLHFDTKRLPLLTGESPTNTHEYLFIAIDDFSRELYGSVQPDKTQYSSERFLKQVIDECPYTIETAYSDNGLEYRGNGTHAFAKLCKDSTIEQRFTKVKTPRTNGKAERVIRTVLGMWHRKTRFASRAHRKTELIRFINFYNTVESHKGIDNMTPLEKLLTYFYPTEL